LSRHGAPSPGIEEDDVMAGEAKDQGGKDKIAQGMDESGKGAVKDTGGKAMKGGPGGGSSEDVAKGMSKGGSGKASDAAKGE
jgi:hypothetical protein